MSNKSKFAIKKVLARLFECEESVINPSWLSNPRNIPSDLLTAKITNEVIIAIARWKAANTTKRVKLLSALLSLPYDCNLKQARLVWETEDMKYKLARCGDDYLNAEFDHTRLMDDQHHDMSSETQLTPSLKKLHVDTPKRKHTSCESKALCDTPERSGVNTRRVRNNVKIIHHTRTIVKTVKFKECLKDTKLIRQLRRLKRVHRTVKEELAKKSAELDNAKVCSKIFFLVMLETVI